MHSIFKVVERVFLLQIQFFSLKLILLMVNIDLLKLFQFSLLYHLLLSDSHERKFSHGNGRKNKIMNNIIKITKLVDSFGTENWIHLSFPL